MIRNHPQVLIVLKDALGCLIGVHEGWLKDAKDEDLREATGTRRMASAANTAAGKIAPAGNLATAWSSVMLDNILSKFSMTGSASNQPYLTGCVVKGCNSCEWYSSRGTAPQVARTKLMFRSKTLSSFQ